MKLVVEEAESEALAAAIAGRGPVVTSVVGEIETTRACRRAGVPSPQVDELRDGLVVLALGDDVRRLAATAGPSTLRTLDAIHLATVLSVRAELDSVVTYDVRLAEAAAAAGVSVLSPS